jgi:hypothetical protein
MNEDGVKKKTDEEIDAEFANQPASASCSSDHPSEFTERMADEEVAHLTGLLFKHLEDQIPPKEES